MPRIVTIVSPDVPHVSLFLGAALARTHYEIGRASCRERV